MEKMMSLYTTRNHRQQFSVSNQKKKKISQCYDNDSFLPDSLPNVANYSLQRKKNNVALPYQNDKNKDHISKISDISLVSENDVNFSLDDNKLPAITSHLSLNHRNQMGFSSSTMSSDRTDDDKLARAEERLQPIRSMKEENSSKAVHDSVIAENDILAEFGMLQVTKLKESDSNVSNSNAIGTNNRIGSDICNGGDMSKVNGLANEEEEHDFVGDGLMFNFDKNLKRKRMSRLKRSATNDETIVREHDPISHLSRCKSIDSTDSFRSCSDEQAFFFSEQSKPVKNKKKFLRRSMSVGFSKFKLITSNLSLKSHHKLNDYDIDMHLKETDHQTSRRKNTTGSMDTYLMQDLVKIDKATDDPSLFPPLLRSLSAPDTIDKIDDEDYDEDLSELHLPRRRAICPNLPVPAMKQLKTYLILTRLKQYCFV